jgi:defect-in-organelle-trafficking protein DotC
MKEKLLIGIGVLTLLSGCGFHKDVTDVDTTNMSQLQGMAMQKTKNAVAGSDINLMRIKALQETALTLGAQGGLAKAAEEINLNLLKDGKRLETIFNFNGMMLSHGVLPPVLVEGNNSLNLDNPDTIRVADKTYRIVKQARFATTPPNWREYLWQSYQKPEVPNKFLLPKTKDEQKVWAKYIAIGWTSGTQQASNIFQESLARLKRDYQGMILYRKLLQEKMISPPYVSRTEMGITGDGDDLRVNDQVLRITEHPQLQTDSKNWKAIVVKQDD